MDDIRDSFSRFKKGIKRRVTGRKRKGGQPGVGGNAEGSDTSGSVPQPEAGVGTGDGHEQGDGANANDERVEQGAAVDENGSDWKSTVSASAKFLLRGVRDSADALGPLKSVAGGLCFFLENYEVWLVPWQCLPAMFTSTLANEGKQTGN